VLATIDTDLALVAAALLGCLALPASLAAYADSRVPWFGLVLLLAGAGSYALAWQARGTPPLPAELPEAFFRVLARLIG